MLMVHAILWLGRSRDLMDGEANAPPEACPNDSNEEGQECSKDGSGTSRHGNGAAQKRTLGPIDPRAGIDLDLGSRHSQDQEEDEYKELGNHHHGFE